MYKRKDQAMTVCQKFLAIAPYDADASISLSKFYNSILYSNKLGLCVNRFKTKNISMVGILKFVHFVHFH